MKFAYESLLTAQMPDRACLQCEGRGFSFYPSFFMDGSAQFIKRECDYCEGKGTIPDWLNRLEKEEL